VSPDIFSRAEGQIWLAGRLTPATGGLRDIVCPATGEVVGRSGITGLQDLDQAVLAAQQAHDSHLWSSIPSLERGRILSRAATGIRAQELALQSVISAENGMPPSAARFIEVAMAADVLDYYGGATSRPYGEVHPFNLPGATTNYLVLTMREPIGVVGLITPWNFPLLMPTWKLAAALAAGCSVILKPAPETPFTALLLAKVLAEAGLPEGVLSVLPGGDDVGEAIVCHEGIPQVALTGGLAAGAQARVAAAQCGKRLSLELGGKSPLILFEDVDLEAAVDAALFGIFLNAGQVCQASSRVLVQTSILDLFLARFSERARALRSGPPSDTLADIGPVISSERLATIDAMVQAARQAGATVHTGGSPLAGPGFFYPPTVISGIDVGMPLAREEVFGPVVVVMPFDDEESAIRLANDTLYGLTAAVWTKDIKRAFRVVRQLAAGTVWVNAVQVLTPTAPFGGFKGSGAGRDLGIEGMAQFQETKTVIVDLNDWPMAFF
jgi:acyl-CoA reductase-like NAD-dependent aldehyde dehydrogenase